jgi:hypothetical protein
MKIALICYHKNADIIYPKEWIDQFRFSILNQTHKDFDIIELNYGCIDENLLGSGFRIFKDGSHNARYFEGNLKSFISGMNILIDYCKFNKYDYIFNTNCDDFYSLDRIEKQLVYLADGYDMVSSNFTLIDENNNKILEHEFDILDLKTELKNDHNIIAHPVVAFNANFFKENKYKEDEIPYEDLKLWQRAISNGSKIKIIKDNLLFHRVHSKSVSNANNDRKSIV